MGIRKGISVVLAVILLFTSIPVNALAADSGTPKLTALTVQTASGEEVDLLGQWSVKADLGDSYSFTATFDHADQIDSVYITSTKGSAVRMLETQRNGASFTTSGWFHGDKNYIPGKIGVQYTMKTKQTSMDDPVDWDALEIEGCTAEITSSSGQLTEANVDLTTLLGAESQVAVDLAVDIFDETTGGNLNEWLGSYKDLELLHKYTLDEGKYILYLDYSDPSTYAMIVHDVSGSKFVKTVLDDASASSQTLRNLSEKLGTINTVSGLALEYFAIRDSVKELRDQVSSRTDLTGEEKAQLRESIDDYENDRLMFTLTMTLLPAVVAASGGTMIGPVLVLNALIGAINTSADYFWANRTGMYEGCGPRNTDFTPDAHGIRLTSSSLSKVNYTLTESGTYYLAGNIGVPIKISSNAYVTICKHGFDCSLVNNGGTLEVRDCTYEEDADGNMIGQGLFTPSAKVTNNDGEVYVYCGEVSVTTPGSGNVRVYEGTVSQVVTKGDGDITVYGGTIEDIENGTGRLQVQDGRVERIVNNGGTVQIDRGLIGGTNKSVAITNNSGEIIVNGGEIRGCDPDDPKGSVSQAISNGNEGRVTIYGGTLDTISNSGVLTIRNGEFLCGQYTDGACLENSGTAEIFDGRFTGQISNNSPFEPGKGLTIHDGTFSSTRDYNVSNSWGRVTIEYGNFRMSGSYTGDCNVQTEAGNAYAELETVIRGGEYYCEGGDCVSNGAGAGVRARTIIEDGNFYSTEGSCVGNAGIMTILQGTFVSEKTSSSEGCVTNTRDGELTISGGSFTNQKGNCCVYSYDTFGSEQLKLTISGGTFSAPEGLSVIEGAGCTLLVGENSNIELLGRFGLFKPGSYTGEFQLTVDTPAGYDGGIVYYDAPEGAGVSVTPAELMAMDFSREKYLRLVGDMSLGGTSSEGVSVSLSGSGEGLRTAKVSDPNQVLTSDTLVWAASYEGGKMTGITSGILKADGTVTFSEPVEAGAVLFFLDGENKPMCGNILLQPGKTD